MKSNAEPVSLCFAESSIGNKSVHISFDRVGSTLNIRIPASQLGPMIHNLLSVQESLEKSGIDTRKNDILVPAAPYDFFKHKQNVIAMKKPPYICGECDCEIDTITIHKTGRISYVCPNCNEEWVSWAGS